MDIITISLKLVTVFDLEMRHNKSHTTLTTITSLTSKPAIMYHSPSLSQRLRNAQQEPSVLCHLTPLQAKKTIVFTFTHCTLLPSPPHPFPQHLLHLTISPLPTSSLSSPSPSPHHLSPPHLLPFLTISFTSPSLPSSLSSPSLPSPPPPFPHHLLHFTTLKHRVPHHPKREHK